MAASISSPQDTIAAIATPPGKGGVGVIKISGFDLTPIIEGMLGEAPAPRRALYRSFLDSDSSAIDQGIALYFPAPHSYTGENVLELQTHGGIVLMEMLLRRVLALGARLARPGEFTERAFLNDKIDLAQAEAVADLIESSTEQSVRSARRAMEGVFSKQVNRLQESLVELRTFVEAAIDFVEEEIDFLSQGGVEKKLLGILQTLVEIRRTAKQGSLLRDGMTVVIAGPPNAGKSSLLNLLAGREAAIVTEIEGTTRDILRERIQIDGMPLHVIDTAGLRQSEDPVEREGIRRARAEMENADRILFLIDDRRRSEETGLPEGLPPRIGITKIYNKIDLTGSEAAIHETEAGTEIYLSVKTGAGIDHLYRHFKQCVGYEAETEGVFIARRRHLEALDSAHAFIESALNQMKLSAACELVAEDLRQAQNALSEITGEFTSDDLLGRIFSSFCIGK